MVLDLLWSASARSDLLTIVDYISDDNPDAAQRFKRDLEEKTGKLRQFPKIGRLGRVKGTRELVVLSDYIVVYRQESNRILILRVLHGARQWPPFK